MSTPAARARAPAASAPAPASGSPGEHGLRPGAPLPALTRAELQRFERGRAEFGRQHGLETGLGPLFNESSCQRCHHQKGVGGSGVFSSLLAGHAGGGRFDPLLAEGGPQLALLSVTFEAATRSALASCQLPQGGEPVPARANVVARRRTSALFGLGLVDATPDATFVELARKQPAAIRGRAPLVPHLAKHARTVGKFGWKAQAPSLHQFSGMALAVELGVTNPDFPEEQAPLGNPALLAGCDLTPELEAGADVVQRLTDFVQLLAPVAPLEPSAQARAGDRTFTRIGCDGCHVRELRSGPSPIAALSERTYAPFSDFLLHDMGELGDGIGGEGDAAPREMRTAPLWGGHLLAGSRLLHDGRAKSYREAIQWHAGQGAAARDAFLSLSEAEQRELLAFLARL